MSFLISKIINTNINYYHTYKNIFKLTSDCEIKYEKIYILKFKINALSTISLKNNSNQLERDFNIYYAGTHLLIIIINKQYIVKKLIFFVIKLITS